MEALIHKFVCPACGFSDDADGPIDTGVFTCPKCNARVVYGRAMEHVVIEPGTDQQRPLVVIRFQDPRTREDVFRFECDPQFSILLVRELLSIVRVQ
jgi:transcription initiation factor IIE alpha subunit